MPPKAEVAIVSMEEIRASGHQPWKLNNTALKYLRDAHEMPRGTPTLEGLDLTSDEVMIKTLVELGGQAYSFRAPLQPWSWRKMLNGMNDENLRKAVGDSGVERVFIAPLPGS